MIGVCQTGRQPILISAYRDYLGHRSLYGAIYNADWDSHPLRPESINRVLEKVSCPVQGIFGELDNLVPLGNVLRMCNVLATAKKSFDIRVYADAPHGFLNDTMPGRYRASQTQAAWGQILFFLDVRSTRGGTKSGSFGVSKAIPRSTTILPRTGGGSSPRCRRSAWRGRRTSERSGWFRAPS